MALKFHTKYEVCASNNISDRAIHLIFNTLDLVHYSIKSPLWCCTLIPYIKSVGEKASKIRSFDKFSRNQITSLWPWFVHCHFVKLYSNFWTLTLTWDWSRSLSPGSSNVPHWFVPWYQVWSLWVKLVIRYEYTCTWKALSSSTLTLGQGHIHIYKIKCQIRCYTITLTLKLIGEMFSS